MYEKNHSLILHATNWIQKLKASFKPHDIDIVPFNSFLLFFSLHPHVMNWAHMSQNCRACTRVLSPSLIPLRSSTSKVKQTTHKYQYNNIMCIYSSRILIHTRLLLWFIILMYIYIVVYIFQHYKWNDHNVGIQY